MVKYEEPEEKLRSPGHTATIFLFIGINMSKLLSVHPSFASLCSCLKRRSEFSESLLSAAYLENNLALGEAASKKGYDGPLLFEPWNFRVMKRLKLNISVGRLGDSNYAEDDHRIKLVLVKLLELSCT